MVLRRMSKYAHFMVLGHSFMALEVAQAYLNNVFKLHGVPNSIVSDRDVIFLSQFWQALFIMHGMDLLVSFFYHS